VVQNGSMLTSPSANLHAETVTGGEVGPVLTSGRVEARGVAYYADVASPISVVSVDDHRETANLGRAREAGIDAAASVRLARPVLAGVAYTFSTTRVIAGGAQSGLDGSSLAGNELAQRPRHSGAATLTYDEPRIVTVAGAVRYIGARYEDVNNTSRVRPTAVVDAMATRRLTHGLAGFVAVENVFDRRYTSHSVGVDQLGAPRMFHVGVRLDSARW
jgi:outer membrane receptor protein involved in Fe transport